MPGVLHNSPGMPPTTYPSNGARLVSRTGEALPLTAITMTGTAVGGIARIRLQSSPTVSHRWNHLRLSARPTARAGMRSEPQSADWGASSADDAR
jgi:hypothetical protein